LTGNIPRNTAAPPNQALTVSAVVESVEDMMFWGRGFSKENCTYLLLREISKDTRLLSDNLEEKKEREE
jgi:hypothetical protein